MARNAAALNHDTPRITTFRSRCGAGSAHPYLPLGPALVQCAWRVVPSKAYGSRYSSRRPRSTNFASGAVSK